MSRFVTVDEDTQNSNLAKQNLDQDARDHTPYCAKKTTMRHELHLHQLQVELETAQISPQEEAGVTIPFQKMPTLC